MYGFFYPENGRPYLELLRFDTVTEAIEWWRDRRSHWTQIEATGNDLAAFVYERTGEMVVLREVENPLAEEESP